MGDTVVVTRRGALAAGVRTGTPGWLSDHSPAGVPAPEGTAWFTPHTPKGAGLGGATCHGFWALPRDTEPAALH